MARHAINPDNYAPYESVQPTRRGFQREVGVLALSGTTAGQTLLQLQRDLDTAGVTDPLVRSHLMDALVVAMEHGHACGIRAGYNDRELAHRKLVSKNKELNHRITAMRDRLLAKGNEL